MDSSQAALGFVGSPWSDPYLWCGAAAFFAGLAGGLVLRAFWRSRRLSSSDRRRRSARFAWAIAHLSLGILCLAGLFILADKGCLAEAWGDDRLVLLASSAAALLVGICAGYRPLVLGLPAAGALAAALGALGLAIAGWIPLRADAAQGTAVARLLPYKVEARSFGGQLELPERDSVPVVQDLSLAAGSAGLRVECLELGEPLRLAACVVSARARSAPASSPDGKLRFYRVAGVVGEAAAGAAPGGGPAAAASFVSSNFPGPAHMGLLDALLPLPPREGLEPGSAPARATAFLGLALRLRLTSACSPLVPLEPVSFVLRAPAYSLEARTALRP